MFSVLFENGHTKDMRSNTLVFSADPHFAAPSATAVPLQVHIIILRSITIPAAILPPPSVAILGALVCLSRLIGQEAAIQAPWFLQETFPTDHT